MTDAAFQRRASAWVATVALFPALVGVRAEQRDVIYDAVSSDIPVSGRFMTSRKNAKRSIRHSKYVVDKHCPEESKAVIDCLVQNDGEERPCLAAIETLYRSCVFGKLTQLPEYQYEQEPLTTKFYRDLWLENYQAKFGKNSGLFFP